MLALKYSQLKAELVKWIPTILSLAMDAEKNLQSNIIVYTFGVSGLKEEEINRLIEEIPLTVKSTVMNTLDIFIEKGKKIGHQDGIIEGDKKKTDKIVRNLVKSSGLTNEQIASAAEVTVDFVARIREALKIKE